MADEADTSAPIDDVRSALTEAFNAPETAPAPSAPSTPESPSPASREYLRDDQGKFAPKPEGAASPAPSPEGTAPAPTPEGTASPPQGEPTPIPLPRSWGRDKQALWDQLHPDVQRAVHGREDQIARGFQENARRYKPLQELDEAIADYKANWELRGVTPTQMVGQLAAAQAYLERDPIGGIRWLCESYRIDPRALLAAATNQEGQQPQPQDPTLAKVIDAIGEIRQTVSSIQGEREEAFKASVRGELHAFQNDPKNVHFEAVREDMAQLLGARLAKDLPDAYDQACWRNPAVRARLMQSHAANGAPAPSPEAKRAAAVSVTGAPTGPVASGRKPADSVREELEAAFAGL